MELQRGVIPIYCILASHPLLNISPDPHATITRRWSRMQNVQLKKRECWMTVVTAPPACTQTNEELGGVCAWACERHNHLLSRVVIGSAATTVGQPRRLSSRCVLMRYAWKLLPHSRAYCSSTLHGSQIPRAPVGIQTKKVFTQERNRICTDHCNHPNYVFMVWILPVC